MAIRLLTIFSVLLLQGCSTLCFVHEKQNASNIELFDMGFSHNPSEEQAAWYQEISKKCELISFYSNGVGTAIPSFNSAVKLFRVNSKSHCLIKKSKNDAANQNGNLVVHGAGWHFEDGTSEYASAYMCEEQFIDKVRAHNKPPM